VRAELPGDAVAEQLAGDLAGLIARAANGFDVEKEIRIQQLGVGQLRHNERERVASAVLQWTESLLSVAHVVSARRGP
jgi:hypothetical protein